ncbi:MAG TPA: hypothetical protein VFW87_07640 [Pirellulales bacterium]|nr:hypothetical protein [Pirellulales bacterium]
MAQAEKQHVLGFYEGEPEAAAREAVASYWRSYANELERQYAAQRVVQLASKLTPPISSELDSLWKKTIRVLNDVERQQRRSP